jgi:hypothetical protein
MLRGAGVLLIDTADAPGRDEAQLADWGELGRDGRLEVFHAALRDIVWPGFEHAEIDVGIAKRWVAAHVPRRV